MDPKRYQQVKDILLQALELAANERPDFVARATLGDADLEAEVTSLLSEHEAPAAIVDRGFVGEQHEHVFDALHQGLEHADSSYPTQTPADGEPEVLPQTGMRVRHYDLMEELGRGGMGQVFLALDTKLGRRVALKFLRLRSPELIERFLAEARVTAQCHHENIVVIYEVDEALGLPYLALEYLDGQPLSEMMKDGPLEPKQAVGWILPVVRALACAHALGIVHRDLKPDNIFITHGGQVKVLDFGIAKLFDRDEDSLPERLQSMLPSDSGLTQKGALLGTVPYMSPEQWGLAEVDHRSDLWAVGIILWQMLTGKHPLTSPTPPALRRMAEATDEPMPLIETQAAEIPSDLAQTVNACLAKNKDARVESAERLQRQLEAVFTATDSGDLSAPSIETPPAIELSANPSTRRPTVLLRIPPVLMWVVMFVLGWILLGMSIGLDVGTSYTASINWGPLFILLIPFLVSSAFRVIQASDNALAGLADAGLIETTPQLGLHNGVFRLWRERLSWSPWIIGIGMSGGIAVSVGEWWARYRNQPVPTEWWTESPALGLAGSLVQGLTIGIVVTTSIVMISYGWTLLDVAAGRAGVTTRINPRADDGRGGFGIFQEPLEASLVFIGLLYTALWASNVQHIAIVRGAAADRTPDVRAVLTQGPWFDMGPGHYSSQMTVIACLTTLSLGALVIYWIHQAYWSTPTKSTAHSPWLLPYLPLPWLVAVMVMALLGFIFFRFGLFMIAALVLIVLWRIGRALTPT